MKSRFAKMTITAWQKIAPVLLGLLLAFVLLEAGLRLGGFVFSSMQTYENFQSTRQKNTYRILCIGESTTQRQYPHLLERVLNQRNIGVRVSVIDKGRVAMNSVVLLEEIESNLAEYHPDMVVAMMGINDGGRHMPLSALITSERTPFIKTFRTYKLAHLLWLRLLAKAKAMGLYREQSIFDQAEDSLKKAIRLNPKNDQAYAEIGWLYYLQRKNSEAEVFFKKSLEINPENVKAFCGLGWLYFSRHELSRSEDFFKKAIEIDPKSGGAHRGLGQVYKLQGQFAQAEESYKKAAVLGPERDTAYFALGMLYREYGQLSRAEDSFRQAIERNPKNARVLGVMSSLSEQMGKFELAKEYAEKINTLRSEYYTPATVSNYRKLKEILDTNRIQLVCVQYPMQNVEPLKRIFEKDEGVIFVDNERTFKEAVRKGSYEEYFRDMFGGDFGHCTQKGNMLLAQNIADVILKEVFKK